MAVTYEFRVDGKLTQHARDAFCDMEIEEVPPGLILRGTVIDEAHLYGIISTFRMLGLSVVFAHPLPVRSTGRPTQ
jgi:hypothetical protein